MKRMAVAASLAALVATAAFAGPVDDREALMKSFGKAVGMMAPIYKGEKPFDAAAVKQALATLDEQVQKLDVDVLFPKDSISGDSTASPKIWEKWDDFKAHADKLKADVKAAAAAPAADLAAFKTQFEGVTSNCGSCHQAFRIKKS